MGVDVIAQQSHLIRSDPDVSIAVACHAIDITVDTHVCQSQLLTDGGVPDICTLVISEQGALTVEPDIIHLVGKGTQGFRTAQLLVGNLIGAPDSVLLVHHVAAEDSSVVVDDERTILTLADRADSTLRYAM